MVKVELTAHEINMVNAALRFWARSGGSEADDLCEIATLGWTKSELSGDEIRKRAEKFAPKAPPVVCSTCCSPEVQLAAWVSWDGSTGAMKIDDDEGPSHRAWCHECQDDVHVETDRSIISRRLRAIFEAGLGTIERDERGFYFANPGGQPYAERFATKHACALHVLGETDDAVAA